MEEKDDYSSHPPGRAEYLAERAEYLARPIGFSAESRSCDWVGKLNLDNEVDRLAKNKYGDFRIFVVFISHGIFKPRIRLDTKSNTLYMDIILDPDLMANSSYEETRVIMKNRLLGDLREVLEKYKKKKYNYDIDRLISDLDACIKIKEGSFKDRLSSEQQAAYDAAQDLLAKTESEIQLFFNSHPDRSPENIQKFSKLKKTADEAKAEILSFEKM